MSTTIFDIARELGVSASTVSKVLNNRKGVSDAVRLRILTAAEQMGYKPYVEARNAGNERKNAQYVVEVVGDVNHYLVKRLSNGINEVLQKANYYHMRYVIDPSASDSDLKLRLFCDHILTDKNVIGVIIAFLDVDEKLILSLHRANIFVSLVHCGMMETLTSHVTIDNVSAAQAATAYFLSTGCRNPTLVIPAQKILVWQERQQGFRKALREAGVEYSPDMVEYEDTLEFAGTMSAVKRLLTRMPQADAILFASDVQAFAGIRYLRDNEIRIPEQISIIGFDNLDFDEIVDPTLTSVDQPMERLGEIAVTRLLTMIQNQRAESYYERLEATLVRRGSTR